MINFRNGSKIEGTNFLFLLQRKMSQKCQKNEISFETVLLKK